MSVTMSAVGNATPADAPLSIAIVGAGIGGLTAALALSAVGHTVTLIERRIAFSDVGAGLQISPNASRVLIGLGLGPALRRVANEPPGVAIRALVGGRRIGGIELGASVRRLYGAPYYVLHRADLQTILLDAVRSRASVRLLLGRDVTAVRQDAEAAYLSISSLDGRRAETTRADLVVGADGVRSVMRSRFDDRGLTAHRQAAWRATIAMEAAPADFRGAETGLWLGPRRHVVHYPIGGNRLNVVAIVPEREGDDDWGRLGDPAVLRHHLHDAAAPLQALLGVPDTWAVWSLVDRSAVRPIARKRLALLGDAAHPVLPFLAQGAAMAIEDAAVLADCISRGKAMGTALVDYAARRAQRVGRVQREARRNGRYYHAGSVVGLVRDAVIRQRGPAGMSRRYGWLYGWVPP